MTIRSNDIEINIIGETCRLTALNGASNVSISLLSKQLDFSKSNIYHYFSSKDEIFIRLVSEKINEFNSFSVINNDKENSNINLRKIIDYLLEGDIFPGLDLYVILNILQDYPSNIIIKDMISRLFSDIQTFIRQVLILRSTCSEKLANELSKNIFSIVCGEILLSHANGSYKELNKLYKRIDDYVINLSI